jgi:hypothetical protein
MQPYDRMFGLEKMCLIFIYNPKEFLFIFFCVVMGMEKINKNLKGIISYVVMFGYGRRPSHCNAHT